MKFDYKLTLKEFISVLKTYNFPITDSVNADSSMQLRLGSNLLSFLSTIYGAKYSSDIVPFLEQYGVVVTQEGTTMLAEYVKEVLDLFSSRYADSYIMSVYDLNNDALKSGAKKTLDHIIDVLINTYPKFKELLAYYGESKGKLLDAIKASYSDEEEFQGRNRLQNESVHEGSTSGKSHVNDTPQNAIVDGGSDYSSESFASTIDFASSEEGASDKSRQRSQNQYSRTLGHTSENDRDTLIERLESINTKFELIYKRWTDEFGRLTWEELE